MKIFFAISVTILFFSSHSLAQTGFEPSKKPIQLRSKSASSGYYSPGFEYPGGSGPSYIFRVGVYGIEQKVNFFGDNLKELVKDNEKALAEMEMFAKKRTNMVLGYVMAGGGVLITMAGLEKTNNKVFDPRTGGYEDKYKLTGIGIFGIGAAFTGIIVAAVNGNGATKYIEQAVSAYNEGLGITSDEDGVSMNIKITPSIEPNYIGIGMKVSLF